MLVAMVLFAGGCKIGIRVGVDTAADGSGNVVVTATLDQEATNGLKDKVGGDLAVAFKTDDLVQAGWTITGPTTAKDGTTTIVASKPFTDPAGATAVVAELSGANGPFKDFKVARRQGLFSTRTTFSGTVDLVAGAKQFGDEELRQQLGSEVGVDPAELERRERVVIDKFFGLSVVARLPGSLASTNAPGKAGNGALWEPKAGQQAQLIASSTIYRTVPIAGAAVTGFAALVFVGLLGVRLARRR